jgi:hypothetical protein
MHELEMLGNDGLAHLTQGHQFANRLLAFLEFLKELETASVAEDPEDDGELVESRRSHLLRGFFGSCGFGTFGTRHVLKGMKLIMPEGSSERKERTLGFYERNAHGQGHPTKQDGSALLKYANICILTNKKSFTTVDCVMRKFAYMILGLASIAGILSSGAAPEMRGPLPEEQRNIIHELAEHHQQFERKVTMTAKGYTATTTTKNKELARKLQTHVAYMKKRMESGAMVRRWDPAYAEMSEHYDDLEATIEKVEGGVRATINGKNDRAIKIAQNHAKIVTSFTRKGMEEVEKEHPATTGEEASTKGGGGGPGRGKGRGQGK